MTHPSVTHPSVTDAAADLHCPLCGYSLRGLTEPRCPECGFAFDWAELLDERRDRHPWLFEHAGRRPPRRWPNARAFVATYARTAFPRRFWLAVTPANPVHVGRLLAYWAVANAALLLTVAVPFARTAVDLGRDDRALRRAYQPLAGSPGWLSGPSASQVRQYRSWGTYFRLLPPRYFGHGGNTAAEVDAVAPPICSAAFARQVWAAATTPGPRLWANGRPPDGGATAVTGVAVLLAWPWLTVAGLLVFRASMRRAKVDARHLLRVAVYGCDVAVPAGLAAAVLFGTSIAPPAASPWDPAAVLADRLPLGPFRPDAAWVLVPVLLGLTIVTYRLSVAAVRYLRLDRPVLAVLAAQVMVVLAVGIGLLRTVRLF